MFFSYDWGRMLVGSDGGHVRSDEILELLRSREFARALRGGVLGGLLFFLIQLFMVAISLKIGFSRKVLASLAADFGMVELFLSSLPSFSLLLLLNSAMVGVSILMALMMHYARPAQEHMPIRVWMLLLLLWLTVFWENARLFPSSIFASGLSVPVAMANISAWYLWLAGGVGCLLVGAWRNRHYPVLGSVTVVCLAAVFLPLLSGASRAPVSQIHASGRPNVFIIGIDSLRIDRVGVLGGHPSMVPQVDRLLVKGAVFPTAYTTIARTYPSWMGILSGRHPLHSGARVNLMAQEQVDKASLLPVALRQAGYRTVYAMDERRFSGIDQKYGFDDVVGPPVGVRDFLAQGTRDNPLFNLLVSTGPGRYLLPYHHANRALDLTYKPKDFHGLLQLALAKRDSRPLFMTAHFCLPHWPYKWGEEEALHKTPMDHYHAALRQADDQVGLLLQELAARGYLDNAILVLLSDHGEAHGLISDMPYQLNGKNMGAVWGHGTDVLSPAQNRVVLGFVGFGPQAERIRAAVHSNVVTLLDVAPTVAGLLDIDLPWRIDGRSLARLLGGQAAPVDMPIFLESEFDLPGVSQANPDVRQLVSAGIGYYRLTSDGRVELTKDALGKIIQAKQRAVVDQGMILAIYPHHESPKMLLVNESSGQARQFELVSCRAEPVCNSLLSRLENFYGLEIQRNPLMPQNWSGTKP